MYYRLDLKTLTVMHLIYISKAHLDELVIKLEFTDKYFVWSHD